MKDNLEKITTKLGPDCTVSKSLLTAPVGCEDKLHNKDVGPQYASVIAPRVNLVVLGGINGYLSGLDVK